MERKMFLANLFFLIVLSCDNYQYNFANKDGMEKLNENPDPKQTNSAPDLAIKNPYIFSLDVPMWIKPMPEIEIEKCRIAPSNPGNFVYPNMDCEAKKMNDSVEYIPSPKHCDSLFSLNLKNSEFSMIPDTSQGQWKVRINGEYKTRNFFRLQPNGAFAYWIDSMEIYAKSGSSYTLLGTIQGNDWLQDDLKMDVLAFESRILSNFKINSIYIRFIRRCAKGNFFNFTELDPIPLALISEQLSKFIIDSVEFVKIQ